MGFRHRARAAAAAFALGAGIAALPQAASAFAIYTVGGDAACGFSEIQDALDAAAENPGEDYVWIAMNQSYAGQQLLVEDQDVDIEGGFVDCSDFDIDTAQTTVSGAGNDGWAVFSIAGNSHVFMANLFITGADRSGDASGGGIYFGGTGALALQTVTVGANYAGYGGGMNVSASGGPVAVTLLHDTLFLNNTAAVSGGGIRIEGDTRLIAVDDNTTFTLNSAIDGYGGGLEILGPARADIGSPGYNGLAMFYGNDADTGGAIAVIGASGGAAFLRMFTTDPTRPTRIDDNFASGRGGGGIYTNSAGGFQGVACLYDFALTNNIAADGAAIYADQGLAFYINTAQEFDPNCGPEPAASLGAVACAAGAGCNAIEGNLTQHADGSPSAGAVVKVDHFSQLEADRFRMTGNLGAWMIRVDDGFPSVVSNCLIANNGASSQLIGAITQSAMTVNSCTLTGNGIDSGYAIANDYALSLNDTIIDQPGLQAIDYGGDGALLFVDYVLANDVSTLAGSATAIQGAPTFVDAAGGNFHLRPISLGVDFAPAAANFDLDGNTRNTDLVGVPNVYGPLDLGAFETLPSCTDGDLIFCNGFDG